MVLRRPGQTDSEDWRDEAASESEAASMFFFQLPCVLLYGPVLPASRGFPLYPTLPASPFALAGPSGLPSSGSPSRAPGADGWAPRCLACVSRAVHDVRKLPLGPTMYGFTPSMGKGLITLNRKSRVGVAGPRGRDNGHRQLVRLTGGRQSRRWLKGCGDGKAERWGLSRPPSRHEGDSVSG